MLGSAILLIDDNAVQAATRQAILRRAGHHVVAALSPEPALERIRAREFPEPIGLVITDHVMPGMTGSIFARALRTFDREMPILVISGMEEAEEEYAGLEVVFRQKPLSPENLLTVVDSLLTARKAS